MHCYDITFWKEEKMGRGLTKKRALARQSTAWCLTNRGSLTSCKQWWAGTDWETVNRTHEMHSKTEPANQLLINYITFLLKNSCSFKNQLNDPRIKNIQVRKKKFPKNSIYNTK